MTISPAVIETLTAPAAPDFIYARHRGVFYAATTSRDAQEGMTVAVTRANGWNDSITLTREATIESGVRLFEYEPTTGESRSVADQATERAQQAEREAARKHAGLSAFASRAQIEAAVKAYRAQQEQAR